MFIINLFMIYTATGFSDDTDSPDYWCAMSDGLAITCAVLTGIALIVTIILTFFGKYTFQSTIWTGYIDCAVLTSLLLYFCDAVNQAWKNNSIKSPEDASQLPKTNAMYTHPGLYARRPYYLRADGANSDEITTENAEETKEEVAEASTTEQEGLQNPKLLQVMAFSFISIDLILFTGMQTFSPVQDLVNMTMFFITTARLCQFVNCNYITAFHKTFRSNDEQSKFQTQIVVAYTEIGRITFAAIALMAFGCNSEVLFSLYWNNNQLCAAAARLQISFLFFVSLLEFLRGAQTFSYILNGLDHDTYYFTSQLLHMAEYVMRYLFAVITIFLLCIPSHLHVPFSLLPPSSLVHLLNLPVSSSLPPLFFSSSRVLLFSGVFVLLLFFSSHQLLLLCFSSSLPFFSLFSASSSSSSSSSSS
jgi:hypothetical protein